MAYKQYENKLPNPLFDVISRKYSWNHISLFFVSSFLIGLLLNFQDYLITTSKPLFIFLFVFAIFHFFLSLYPFLKSALFKSREIIWPSFLVVFINILYVVFFTGLLMMIIYLLDDELLSYISKNIRKYCIKTI